MTNEDYRRELDRLLAEHDQAHPAGSGRKRLYDELKWRWGSGEDAWEQMQMWGNETDCMYTI